MNKVMKVVKQFGCTVFKQDAQLFCSMEIGVPKISLTEVLSKLGEIRGVETERCH